MVIVVVMVVVKVVMMMMITMTTVMFVVVVVVVIVVADRTAGRLHGECRAADRDQLRRGARSVNAAIVDFWGHVSERAERGVLHCRDMLTPALACHDDAVNSLQPPSLGR